MKKTSPLSITGFGCLSAAGASTPQTLQTLFSRETVPLDVCDLTEKRFFKLRIESAWHKKFDFSPGGQTPNLFALVAAQEALRSAGLTSQDLRSLRVGVCLGSTVGGTNFNEEFAQSYTRGMLPDPVVLLDYFRNNTAQFLSRYFSCTGPVQMISNACTSGADAIGIAASWLHADLCDVVICGGTEEILPRIHDGFRSLMLCSPSNSCQPFDISRQGLMLGEGAGVLVLEKISSPRKSKGKFLGYGSASDAMHPTAPHPEARGLETAFASALAQAGLAASSVDFVNAHATATPHNDLAEGKWLARRLAQVPVVATKGYTGHTLGAAGALEAIFTLLSLSENVLPPSKGFSEVDPEIGFAPISARTTGEFHVAASFSLGFGGTNAVVLLGRPT